MNRTIKASEDRYLTERELDAVTGGRIMPPNATVIPFVPAPDFTNPTIPLKSGNYWY